MKAKIVKRLLNDTDFELHVLDMKNGHYMTLVYDGVSQEYDKSSARHFLTLKEAVDFAKKENKNYSF
jgi:hypothetical protein